MNLYNPAPDVARRDTILKALEASKRPYSRHTHLSNTKSILIQNIEIRKALNEVYLTGEINKEILEKSAIRMAAIREKANKRYMEEKGAKNERALVRQQW